MSGLTAVRCKGFNDKYPSYALLALDSVMTHQLPMALWREFKRSLDMAHQFSKSTAFEPLLYVSGSRSPARNLESTSPIFASTSIGSGGL